MVTRWYESRMVQAALVTGTAAIIVAFITVFGQASRQTYPPLEIKSLVDGSEQTLARLALQPANRILDSADFEALPVALLAISESLGVAMAKPEGQDWTTGALGLQSEISIDDSPFFGFLDDAAQAGWPTPADKLRLHYFGVRRDHPTHITLTGQSTVGNVPLGTNPFRDPKYIIGWMRMNWGNEMFSLPADTLAKLGMQITAQMDSIIGARLPRDKDLYSGVFVARMDPGSIPLSPLVTWIKRDPLDDLVSYFRSTLEVPSVLLLDRAKSILILNETIRLGNIIVEGRSTKNLIVNRVGYATKVGASAYMVLLQYVSSDDPVILPQLQSVFRSVRIRKGAA
jgi:hypothetical protein